jgi:hypothetical protein
MAYRRQPRDQRFELLTPDARIERPLVAQAHDAGSVDQVGLGRARHPEIDAEPAAVVDDVEPVRIAPGLDPAPRRRRVVLVVEAEDRHARARELVQVGVLGAHEGPHISPDVHQRDAAEHRHGSPRPGERAP